jgi:hypothetical protein
MCTEGFQILIIASINAKNLKIFSASILIVSLYSLVSWSDPDPAYNLNADPDPDPGSREPNPCGSMFFLCIVELHGLLMAFRGARNMRMSVGSMNPFQTMGKADFTLIDPR